MVFVEVRWRSRVKAVVEVPCSSGARALERNWRIFAPLDLTNSAKKCLRGFLRYPVAPWPIVLRFFSTETEIYNFFIFFLFDKQIFNQRSRPKRSIRRKQLPIFERENETVIFILHFAHHGRYDCKIS